jgi:hypothetical protein
LETIIQPKNSKIDRNVSTKIKVDNQSFKIHIFENIQGIIKEENQNQDKPEKRQKNILNVKRYIKNILKKEIIKKEKKSKLLIQTDLPSFDLELDKIGIYEENESFNFKKRI